MENYLKNYVLNSCLTDRKRNNKETKSLDIHSVLEYPIAYTDTVRRGNVGSK